MLFGLILYSAYIFKGIGLKVIWNILWQTMAIFLSAIERVHLLYTAIHPCIRIDWPPSFSLRGKGKKVGKQAFFAVRNLWSPKWIDGGKAGYKSPYPDPRKLFSLLICNLVGSFSALLCTERDYLDHLNSSQRIRTVVHIVSCVWAGKRGRELGKLAGRMKKDYGGFAAHPPSTCPLSIPIWFGARWHACIYRHEITNWRGLRDRAFVTLRQLYSMRRFRYQMSSQWWR